ncbi:SDR family NAD(P)-dependent oxidoreductase [Haloarchaeobius sp. DYHT-AS-18]|uniref:SDR family NAD(P)-dependent oxidoreductase n=1 Tax=Haloarchaeobius sp. DYHT-AS-18 TaxID=3446117 RepID=UPI003EC01B0A
MVSGSTAIVTGGGRGIGRAICCALAAEGADVVIADIDREEMAETAALVEEEGVRGYPVQTDLRSFEDIEATVEEVLEEFGSIDILVNNAGIAGPTAECEAVEPEEWDQTMAVNLRGPFLMCRQVLPSMKEQGYGRIVNISSVTGKRPLTQRTPYATAKMGLIGFTRTLAAEVGEDDINVNAVCPGSVDGPRIDRVFEAKAEAQGRTYEEVRGDAEAESPRRELVQKEDIAQTVSYLCSSSADRITGQDVNVSAGKVMY